MLQMDKEPIIEAIPETNGIEFTWASIAAAFFVVFIVTVFLILKSRRKQKNTFLIVGLSDSGKTLIYSKLINKDVNHTTYTSLKENVYNKLSTKHGEENRLVDYPGAEKLRTGLFDNWLKKELPFVRGVIFVIDSGTFNRKLRDVAELLYDVLYQLKMNKSLSTPLLIACSKQDNSLAKSEKAISDALEREFGLINISRAAALSSTDGRAGGKLLTLSGGDFSWMDLKMGDLNFYPTSAIETDEFDLKNVREWINSH
uniref:Signal recognition particle receptor subunit beta n=1 Tax=Panagrolaimus superbus TaxID=310955 RepID=A0A914YD75_9BILA